MTPKQNKMYRFEWQKCLRELRKLRRIEPGAGRVAEDALRREIHSEAEVPESSADFTHRDLDRILAVFKSYSAAMDFDAQMRQQDQPAARCRARAEQLMDEAGKVEPEARERYLTGMAKKMIKRDVYALEDLSQAEWSKILAALQYAAYRTGKKPRRGYLNTEMERTVAPELVEEDMPF